MEELANSPREEIPPLICKPQSFSPPNPTSTAHWNLQGESLSMNNWSLF